MASPTTIEDLTAIEQIRRLKARYFRFLDTKQWDELATVWTDDAVLDVTAGRSVDPAKADESLISGRSAIMTFLRGVVDGVLTVHQGHQSEIELDGPDHATGVWAMTDHLRWPDGARELDGWGHYTDRYERVDGTWLIARCALTRLRVDIRTPAQTQGVSS